MTLEEFLEFLHECEMPRDALSRDSVSGWWAEQHEPLRSRVAGLTSQLDDALNDSVKVIDVCVSRLSEMRQQVLSLETENRALARYWFVNQKIAKARGEGDGVEYACQLEDSVKARVTERNNARNEARRLAREAAEAEKECENLVGETEELKGKVEDLENVIQYMEHGNKLVSRCEKGGA